MLIGAIVYTGLVWFWQYREDAEAKLSQVEAVHQTSENVHKTVKEENQKVIESLGGTITKLGNVVADLQKQVNDIHGSNIITGKKPVPVEVTNPQAHAPGATDGPQVNVASMWATPRPEYGKVAKEFILTTTKVMDGAHVAVTCENKINQGTAQLAGGSAMMSGGGGIQGDHTYIASISSPNWSPRAPLVMTLFFDEPDLGKCTFTLQ